MKILIIHQNFPGQFRRIAKNWAERPGWKIIGIGARTAPGLDGVRLIRYDLHRTVATHQHPYLRQMEGAVLHGQAVARVLLNLRRSGFIPDVILAHPGWGETLYSKEVYPNVRLIHFSEWFYGTSGSDIGFDPEFPDAFDSRAKVKTWNALHLLNLEACDAAISPTNWQKSRHPITYQQKIQVAHEGIDTDLLKPDKDACFTTPNGKVLKRGAPIITYVARNLEPYRGFHQFMRALPEIQSQHPNCETIIVGGDDVSYGAKPKGFTSWREKLVNEVSLDMQRTHFLGKIPYDAYRKVLQVSSAHVYLSYPFVLSWSCLEAMSSGCVVVGSKTPPVQEVIDHGKNGYLVDFFDLENLTDTVLEVLRDESGQKHIRQQAREHVRSRYGLAEGQYAYDRLLMP